MLKNFLVRRQCIILEREWYDQILHLKYALHTGPTPKCPRDLKITSIECMQA